MDPIAEMLLQLGYGVSANLVWETMKAAFRSGKKSVKELTLAIKTGHSEISLPHAEALAAVAAPSLAAFENATASNGSNIYAPSAVNSQIAHEIRNEFNIIGRQERGISKEAAAVLLQQLERLQPKVYDLSTPNGDAEAERFARVIADILKHAGWTLHARNSGFDVPTPTGITIFSPAWGPHEEALLAWFESVNCRPRRRDDNSRERLELNIGQQP